MVLPEPKARAAALEPERAARLEKAFARWRSGLWSRRGLSRGRRLWPRSLRRLHLALLNEVENIFLGHASGQTGAGHFFKIDAMFPRNVAHQRRRTRAA